MIDNQINTIHTPCKDCVFAVYTSNTQTDCALKYIDKYRHNNIQILEAYDDSKEFYIINGKKCIGYRENKWFKQFDLQDADLTNKISKYNETNHLDYIMIVDLKQMSIDSLDSLLKQISLCDIAPKKVILIRYTDDELKFPYNIIEDLFKKNQVNYAWRIQTILDMSLSYDHIVNNVISLNSKYRFVVSINKHNTDIKRMIAYTNQLVHHDLGQFDIITNHDRSCIIFSTIIYRFDRFHGNDLLNNPDNYQIV